MPTQTCTCPPVVDVMRGRAGDTRHPCPLHPEPEYPPGTFLPRIESKIERYMIFKPGTDFYNHKTARGRARRS
jgi:hypothetical protein